LSASLTRQIYGIVFQANGLPLPQARIDLLDTENYVITSVCSDTAGAYAITDVPDGRFKLITTAQGYSACSTCIIVEEHDSSICINICLAPCISNFITGHESAAACDAQLPFTVTVADWDTDLPLSDVTVCITDRRFKQYAVTNDCGEVFFSFPDTVQYISISLKKDGYRPHSRCGVHLSGGYRRIMMRTEHR